MSAANFIDKYMLCLISHRMKMSKLLLFVLVCCCNIYSVTSQTPGMSSRTAMYMYVHVKMIIVCIFYSDNSVSSESISL